MCKSYLISAHYILSTLSAILASYGIFTLKTEVYPEDLYFEYPSAFHIPQIMAEKIHARILNSVPYRCIQAGVVILILSLGCIILEYISIRCKKPLKEVKPLTEVNPLFIKPS